MNRCDTCLYALAARFVVPGWHSCLLEVPRRPHRAGATRIATVVYGGIRPPRFSPLVTFTKRSEWPVSDTLTQQRPSYSPCKCALASTAFKRSWWLVNFACTDDEYPVQNLLAMSRITRTLRLKMARAESNSMRNATSIYVIEPKDLLELAEGSSKAPVCASRIAKCFFRLETIMKSSVRRHTFNSNSPNLAVCSAICRVTTSDPRCAFSTLSTSVRTIGNVSVALLWGEVSVTRGDHQHGDINLRQHAVGAGNFCLVVNTGQRIKATWI